MFVWKIGHNFRENNERMRRHLPGNRGAAFQVKSQRRGAVLHTVAILTAMRFYFEGLNFKKNVWLLCLPSVFPAPCCSFFCMSNVNH